MLLLVRNPCRRSLLGECCGKSRVVLTEAIFVCFSPRHCHFCMIYDCDTFAFVLAILAIDDTTAYG
jgi:hypothetical protein